MRSRRARRSGRRAGVQTLELLLVTPVIVIALIAIMEFGTLHIVQSAVTNAATEAARRAAQGGDIADVVATVQNVASIHNISIDSAANSKTNVVLERGSLPPVNYNISPGITCPPLTPAIIDPNEVRVTVCVGLDKTPIINVLSGFGFPFPKEGLQISAVAKKQYALFSDNFNRPANDDVDASDLGTSGRLAPLAYAEPIDDSLTAPTLTRIAGFELYLGSNSVGQVSHAVVNQDCALAEIEDQGGFTVSLRVVDIASAAASDAEWAGFGVGLSSAVLTATGANDIQQTAPFFLGLTAAGNLQVFQGGVQVGTNILVGPAPRTIAARFTTTSFSGGAASVDLFDNGTLVGTSSFTWSTGANYIGLDANEGGRVDNLLIEANR